MLGSRFSQAAWDGALGSTRMGGCLKHPGVGDTADMHTPHMLPCGFTGQPDDCRTSSRPCIKLPSHLRAKLSSALRPDLATEAGKRRGRANPCTALAPLSNYLPSEAGHLLQHPATLHRDTAVKRCSPMACISHPMVGALPTFPALPERKQAQQRGRTSKVRRGHPRSDEVSQGQAKSNKVRAS